jgi:hypothetical protein
VEHVSIEPLLEGLGLADMVVRLRATMSQRPGTREAGELDFF